MIREKRVISFSFFQQNLHLTREKIMRTFGTYLTVARNSVEVKVLMFQLGALAKVSDFVRMNCKVARDSRRNTSFVISVGRPGK